MIDQGLSSESERRTNTVITTTSLGKSAGSIVLDTWRVTISAGVQDHLPRWEGFRAKPDTGCMGNWARRNIIERIGLMARIRPLESDTMILVDASDHKYYATETISLTWYRNEEPTSR